MYPASELGEDQLTLMPDGRGFANISGDKTSLSRIDNGNKMLPLQYTGLKDKNGKEIYEGDIISMPYNRYPQNWKVDGLSAYGLFFERITNKPYSAPYHWKDMKYRDEIEVIGNIYENPELLQEA